ncbi:hypothetical protein Dsin_023784 [Dipteronia sinensis]|uniref:Major facilitator superfamily (MFS) profile domain-containing protein n=1 Tax=Dipteronia sinensis TaxID=43782 RepID=A0AAE0A5H7_9ROSI|nr:hypothetical protein Dsin_023784 [Dipteronia sinensis]
MERESTEGAGLINSSLLGNGGGSGDEAESGSSATAILVFSTFIAVCGSFIFGTSVNALLTLKFKRKKNKIDQSVESVSISHIYFCVIDWYIVTNAYMTTLQIGYSSPAEKGIIDDLGLSVAEYSVFGSIMSIGAMLGAVMSGWIADLMGRRGAMGISDIFCIMGWLAIIFSKAAWLLDFGRLFIGCGVGILSYVVPVYISEIAPKNLRGRFATVLQVMIASGSAITFFIGAIVSWRALALIEIIPCLVQLLGLFIIPESPRWLAKIGQEKECEAAIHRLRGGSADISQEAAEISDYTKNLQLLPEGRFLDLFQQIYARSLTVGVGLMVLQQLGGANGISFYASSIFESLGLSGKLGTIVMAVIQVPMAIFGILLLDKSGRRPLLMISAAGTCIGCLIAGLSFSLKDHRLWKEVTPALAFVGIQVYVGSFAFGLAGIPWLIMSEIFPINMKGSAGSLVSLVNWFSSWIVSYIFNFLMEWSSAGTFFIFSGIGGLTVLFGAKIVPETKDRTLEEIQASMNPLTAARRQTSWN